MELRRKTVQLAISPESRNQRIEALRATHFDVLIIGGGITGAGALLEASSRGYKAALIDKGDFASGTTGASSKLIHGGLRYLAKGEFRLVYENLIERSNLMKNAPSLVKTIDFVIPLNKTKFSFMKIGSAGYSLALWAYDLGGGIRIGKFHKCINLKTVKSMLPKLNTKRFSQAYLYRDGWCDDVRLTLAVIAKAEDYFDATALNYFQGIEPTRTPGSNHIDGFNVRSTFGGDLEINRAFKVTADVIINATGTDVGRILGESIDGAKVSLRPAKGVHIAFPQDVLPAKVAAVLPVRSDGRTIFVLPWGNYTYVGTTDTDLDSSEIQTTKQDMNYLLGALNSSLDSALTINQISGAWVGTRPLIDSPSKSRGTSNETKDLSRRHLVLSSSDRIISIMGGKLTTFRKMAQDAIDALDQMSQRKTVSISKSLSLDLPQKPEPSFANLAHRYGSRSQIVQYYIKGDESIVYGENWHVDLGEIDYLVERESALRLSDILLRRIRVGLVDQVAAKKIAADVLARLSERLFLDEHEQTLEMRDFESDLAREMPNLS